MCVERTGRRVKRLFVERREPAIGHDERERRRTHQHHPARGFAGEELS
jgi:hypothetical protein